jgi:hypothetical protein
VRGGEGGGERAEGVDERHDGGRRETDVMGPAPARGFSAGREDDLHLRCYESLRQIIFYGSELARVAQS